MNVEIRAVWKSYTIGETVIDAVRGLDLAVPEGEFLAILGHSGCGKSTLLSMIGGLTRPSRGTVTVDGVDIWRYDDAERARLRNRTIGFVFQFGSLIPTLTALDNVVLPCMFGPQGLGEAQRDAAAALLDVVGLGDKFDAFPNELSGGQQRRVAIARAFINQPRIILADEPTGDLDEDTEAEVLKLFLDMCQRHKTTIFMVTHNRDLARNAGRTIQMKGGRIL